MRNLQKMKMVKYYAHRINATHKGRYLLHDITKTSWGYNIQFSFGTAAVDPMFTSMRISSDSGQSLTLSAVFKLMETEKLNKMSTPEKAVYLLTNR